MENGPFEDVFPIEHGDILLLCWGMRFFHVALFSRLMANKGKLFVLNAW